MNLSKNDKIKKSILDCFNYDLTNFFYDDYNEVDSEETPATFMIVYEKKLSEKEFDLFDIVQFRIFFDKDNLTGSNPVNVKFVSANKKGEVTSLHEIIETVISIYGDDDYRKGSWDEEDEQAFSENSFRRVWTIEKGESFLSVEYSEEEGITFSILFFNNLIELTGKELQIEH